MLKHLTLFSAAALTIYAMAAVAADSGHDMHGDHSGMQQKGMQQKGMQQPAKGQHGSTMHETADTGMHAGHQSMEEDAHQGHGVQQASHSRLQKLHKMPSSGKSREAGYDGTYRMESTSALNDTHTQCAQASRGLVMVDNATWAECGGKPDGWSKGIEKSKAMEDHNQHMMH
jgi:hypothetical protein